MDSILEGLLSIVGGYVISTCPLVLALLLYVQLLPAQLEIRLDQIQPHRIGYSGSDKLLSLRLVEGDQLKEKIAL